MERVCGCMYEKERETEKKKVMMMMTKDIKKWRM